MRTTSICVCALLAALGIASCDEGNATEAPAPEGRVNAVMAGGKKTSYADLCDVAPASSANQRFTWPALTAATPAAPKHLRWVNVWATWCKPCIEELPLLARVVEAWNKQGHEVELSLISVDADAEAAKRFLAEHPSVPASLQIGDASQTTAWLAGLGLATGSAIPVHVVVDQSERLLCARSGGIAEEDLTRFAAVMFP
jgi:thiol-disulfide isomerase/thioredoxin